LWHHNHLFLIFPTFHIPHLSYWVSIVFRTQFRSAHYGLKLRDNRIIRGKQLDVAKGQKEDIPCCRVDPF
jgi:hypothetical protein